ncbi:MAG: DUF2254 domain-containing protein [Eubacteriales bacterium]|nr:DUF2254 domain-containing protein [Eubacteriales bacterium]
MLRLKMYFAENKSWIAILKYILISLVISAAAIIIDAGDFTFKEYLPGFMMTSMELSRTILTTLVGSLLTITTFTFSTILTVLNIYTSNFTPRIVSNFLRDKIPMKVMGMYIGGFLYSIINLTVLKEEQTEKLFISGMVGVVYAIVALGYFISFVAKVSRSIQTGNVIARLTEEAEDSIRAALDDIGDDFDGMTRSVSTREMRDIESGESGYLEAIEMEHIFEIMGEEDAVLEIPCRIGQYVSKTAPVLRYGGTAFPDEETVKKLRHCFVIQSKKEVETDYHFAVTKLVEIVLRAISPGVNDPNTAIAAIHKIGELVGLIASYEMEKMIRKEGSPLLVKYRYVDLTEELHLDYEQVVHYGKSDISVMRAVFQSLQTVYDMAAPGNRAAVETFEQYVYDCVCDEFNHPVNLKKITDFRLERVHESEV